jgi:hypothetical protein
VVNGQIVIRPIMVVALTYDHRLLDGREAVTFLGRLTSVLGRPRADEYRPTFYYSQGPRLHRRPGEDAARIRNKFFVVGHAVSPISVYPCARTNLVSICCFARVVHVVMRAPPTVNPLKNIKQGFHGFADLCDLDCTGAALLRGRRRLRERSRRWQTTAGRIASIRRVAVAVRRHRRWLAEIQKTPRWEARGQAAGRTGANIPV